MAGLTWLHLSDWHQKGMEFDRKVIRNALIEDIENRKEIDPNLSKIDFIIFSGDVAFSGKQEEYLGAREELFEPLLKATGLNPDRLFIAPGNHDLDRNDLYLVPCAISQPLKSEIEVQEWLTNDRKRSKLLEPFRPFSNFVESFTGHKQADFAHIHRVKVGDRDIAVLCMNSSWMCGRKNDSGVINDKDFVLVGEPQILFPLSEISNADLKIAVLHHPFDWLAEFDRNRIERRLMQECNFVLRGHQHKPQIDVIHSTLGDCIIIPAGACYNRRIADNPLYINSYNFVNFNFDTNKGIAFLRRWSESKSSWTEDTDSCSNGKFEFTLPQSNSMKLRKRNSAIGLGDANVHAPYIGLSSFSENESGIFFGRRALIGMMENQLRCDPRFLAVVGSSGSGKSSVVQAGLLPIIRRGKLLGFEDVHIISFRPGFNPHDALRQALKAEGISSQEDIWRDLQNYKENWPGKSLVIFIDQFEELFNYSEDKRKKGLDFLEVLSRILGTGSITLLIAVRADFLNSLLSSPLSSYIQTGQINVISMKEDEMREAIFKPAQAIGLTIEPGLDDRIIGDLRGHEDQLPLLEHALYQLWIRGAKGGLLTHKDYSRIGGVSGAVSQWANAAFEKLNPAEQKLSKRIFTRLIQYGKDFNSDRRIQIFSSEIDTFDNEETVNKLIKSLADSRLLVTDYDSSTGSQTIEIIHEALIREWRLLRTWIDEEREFLLWRQMLDGKIIEWESRGYEEFCFLDGSFLEEAKDWLKRKPDDFNQREMQYISASIDRNKKREERVIKDIEAAMRAEDFNLLEHLYVEAYKKHGKEHCNVGMNESQQHNGTLNEDQSDLIFRYLSDGTISFANSAFCTFFSLNTSEINGRKIDEPIFEEQIKSATDLKCLISADHPSITYESQMSMHDGLRWLQWTTRGIFDESGSLVEIQSIGKDITSIRKVEKALQESEERFMLLSENMTDVIHLHTPDPELHFVYVSPSIRIAGYEPSELVGKPAIGLFLEPDGAEIIRQALRRFLENKSREVIEYPAIMKDGSRIWVETTSSPVFDKEGNLIYIACTSREITQRKRAEEALRESQQQFSDIISFLPEAIMAIDLNGKVMIWNQAMEVLTGVLAKDILGKGNYEYSLPFYGYRRPTMVDLVLQPHEGWEAEYLGFKREGTAVVGEVFIPTFGPHRIISSGQSHCPLR